MKERIIAVLIAIWSFINNNPLITGIIATTIGGIILNRIINKKEIKKRKLYEKAVNLLNKGYAVRSKVIFSQILKESIDDKSPFLPYKERAESYMHIKTRKLKLALDDADEAINNNKEDGDAYIVRGRIHSLMDKSKEAIGDFNKALEHYTKCKEEVFLYRGIEYFISKEYDDAIKDFNEALKNKYKPAMILFYRGNTYYHKDEYNEAINDYINALKKKPNDVMVLNNLGCTYAAILDYDRAMKIYNKLLKIEPYYPQALRNRGLLFYNLGNYDYAIMDYNLALGAEPKYYTKLLKGRNKEDETENFDSEEYKNRELEEKQTDATVLFKRGNTFAHKGGFDRAIDDYNQAIEMNSDNDLLIRILCNRANVYSLKNDFLRAIEDYTKALEIKPNKPNKAYKTWILNNRGAAYYAIGDYERAIADYKKAVEIDPEDGTARTNLFHAEEEAAKKIQEKENGR